jgi:hypothetical protein
MVSVLLYKESGDANRTTQGGFGLDG